MREKLTASQIKSLLFGYFRFKRGYYCATEYPINGGDMEDFIAFTENEIICIEIKISKSDFLRDFKTKDKHKSSPNHDKFYFCVSEEIAAFVDEFVRENYPSYGVLVATSDGIKSIKQAKKVVPSYKRNFRSLVLRMSSELANIRVKEFKKENK